jgi:hypothetical protein
MPESLKVVDTDFTYAVAETMPKQAESESSRRHACRMKIIACEVR